MLAKECLRNNYRLGLPFVYLMPDVMRVEHKSCQLSTINFLMGVHFKNIMVDICNNNVNHSPRSWNKQHCCISHDLREPDLSAVTESLFCFLILWLKSCISDFLSCGVWLVWSSLLLSIYSFIDLLLFFFLKHSFSFPSGALDSVMEKMVGNWLRRRLDCCLHYLFTCVSMWMCVRFCRADLCITHASCSCCTLDGVPSSAHSTVPHSMCVHACVWFVRHRITEEWQLQTERPGSQRVWPEQKNKMRPFYNIVNMFFYVQYIWPFESHQNCHPSIYECGWMDRWTDTFPVH